jgi:hypothetical protein
MGDYTQNVMRNAPLPLVPEGKESPGGFTASRAFIKLQNRLRWYDQGSNSWWYPRFRC